MDIVEACKTIRDCNDCFSSGLLLPVSEGDLGRAVGSLKRFLELARGTLIHELDIADYLLCTPQGVRWVLPFVLSAWNSGR